MRRCIEVQYPRPLYMLELFQGSGQRPGLRHVSRVQGHVFQTTTKTSLESADVDVRAYAKYVLREGRVSEKRELLGNLRSRLVYQNKKISLLR